MTTIQVLSNLHIEFQPWQPVPTAADVVALAGDIHCGGQTVGWVKQGAFQKTENKARQAGFS